MLCAARQGLGALCVLWILWPVGVSGAAPAGTVRDIWVEVRINNVPQPDFALLHIDLRGHLFGRLEDVRAWHMKVPGSAEAEDLVRIDDVPGLRARLEEDDLVLRLEAEPDLFAAQSLFSERRDDTPQRGIPAVFMQYNVFAEHSGGAGAGETYSALLQAGSSLGRASFTMSWLGTRFGGASAAAADPGQSSWHRLDTDFQLDFPEYTARLMLGDGVTSPGTLGQSVRFTGAHWATDFATRPGFTPYALPVVSGTATVPSSIELYVNQALVQRTTVEAGPFQLNNIPVPVGQGAVDIRMRDILGNVQQLTVPYLVIPQLIAPGLTTVDFAAGAVREDYGIENFAYGHAFISGAIQHGLNGVATLNASAELGPDSNEVTLRGGGAWRVGRNITVELTPAVSHAAQSGSGGAVEAGVDAVWHLAAFGVHFRSASPGFVELGDLGPGARLRREWATQASMQFGPRGSLGALYAWRCSNGKPATSAGTLTYNVSLGRLGAVGIFGSNTRSSGISDIVAGVTFTHYFGKGITGAATGTANDDASTLNVQVSQAPPPGAGLGWELAHARGGADVDGARIDVRNAYGSGSGEIDSARSRTIGILAWQGGLLWAAGRAWPAQTSSGPAALVEVPDLGGVEVLHDGQRVGRTDSAGRILVPALRPFENNDITVVPEDLPLTALVDSEKLIVRPYAHGVVRGVVPVSAGESRVFVLRLGAHDFVPAGAAVVVDGHTYPVGTEGMAQLPVGHGSRSGVVTWLRQGSSGPGERCEVRLPAIDRATLTDPMELECRALQ